VTRRGDVAQVDIDFKQCADQQLFPWRTAEQGGSFFQSIADELFSDANLCILAAHMCILVHFNVADRFTSTGEICSPLCRFYGVASLPSVIK